MLSILVRELSLERNLIMAVDTDKKNLFLHLATMMLVLMMIITTLLWWFVSPRLHEISEFLAKLSLTALRLFYLILIFSIILVYIICYTGKNILIARFAMRAIIRILYPITFNLGILFGISRDAIRESFTHFNNSFIRAVISKYDPEEILILLPHCLQNTACRIRVTVDVRNCVACGRCDIGELCHLSKKYNIHMAIATGGTLARKIIVERRPKFIIAVACGRDMVEGLTEVFPIPVYGILNRQPEGPCINTRVSVEKIKTVLTDILREHAEETR